MEDYEGYSTLSSDITPSKENEKLYLVCNECGEAFDDITIAWQHNEDAVFPSTFSIRPESEAM